MHNKDDLQFKHEYLKYILHIYIHSKHNMHGHQIDFKHNQDALYFSIYYTRTQQIHDHI